MERLTKRDVDGQAMMDCEKCKADWTGKHGYMHPKGRYIVAECKGVRESFFSEDVEVL